MKTRNGIVVSSIARLLFTTLVLLACLTLVTDTAKAQRPTPTPIKIEDSRPAGGKPERVELGEGKYKLVYRNKEGQVVTEEEYAIGILVERRFIEAVYPNGQEATVWTQYLRPDGSVARYERVRYDRFGNLQERIKALRDPERYEIEKWNPRTKQWEPAPPNQLWSKKDGKWIETPTPVEFDPDTGDFRERRPSVQPASDSSNNRGSSSSANGFAVATEVAGGLNTTTFETPRGKIYVNLPDDMAAGDSLSGTVVAETQGQDDEARTKNQGELSGYVVEIEKQQSSSTNRILKLSIPAAISTTYLVLRDKKGKEVARCEVPIGRQLKTSPPPGEEFGLPTMGQQGSPMEVIGVFDGDVRTTNLTVGGEGIEILAESPRKLVARNTSAKIGPTQLMVSEQGRTATGEFRSLGIRLSAPKLDLLRGEQTTLTVTVLGLEGIKAPVPLVLENQSPGVISMGSANVERISISPSQVQGGTYTTQRPLTGIQRGAFTIAGTVVRDGQ